MEFSKSVVGHAVLSAAGTLLLATAASAHPENRDAVAEAAGATPCKEQIQCGMCHAPESGAREDGFSAGPTMTPDKKIRNGPFFQAITAAGFAWEAHGPDDRHKAGNVMSLKRALAKLKADGTDTDMDGAGDMAELEAGFNPMKAGEDAKMCDGAMNFPAAANGGAGDLGGGAGDLGGGAGGLATGGTVTSGGAGIGRSPGDSSGGAVATGGAVGTQPSAAGSGPGPVQAGSTVMPVSSSSADDGGCALAVPAPGQSHSGWLGLGLAGLALSMLRRRRFAGGARVAQTPLPRA